METLPARKTDRDTSRGINRPQYIRSRVLAILRERGPLTLDGLVQEYVRERTRQGWAAASEQGIRSRCAELVRDKLVEAVPGEYATTRFGNRTKLWRAVHV